MADQLYGTTLWDAYRIGTGMSPGQTSSPSSREIDVEYFERLTDVLADYRADATSEANKAAIERMKSQIELLDIQTSYSTDLREIEAENMRAALITRQKHLESLADNYTTLARTTSAANHRVIQGAVQAARGGNTEAGWSNAMGGLVEVGPAATGVASPELPAIMQQLESQIGGVAWDANTGEVTFDSSVNWGDTQLVQQIEDLGRRAGTAHQTQLGARTRLDDLSGRIQGLGEALQRGDDVTADELSAIDAESRQVFNSANDAYGIMEEGAIAARMAELDEEDQLYKNYNQLWGQLRDDLFPVEGENNRRARVMADPVFQQWAKENGFRRIGSADVVDGVLVYRPGAADDRAFKRYMLQSLQGAGVAATELRGLMEGDGPDTNIGMFRRIANALDAPSRGTGQIVRVSLPADPAAAEAFRIRGGPNDGGFYVNPEGQYENPLTIERMQREVMQHSLVATPGLTEGVTMLSNVTGSGPIYLQIADGRIQKLHYTGMSEARNYIKEYADENPEAVRPMIIRNAQGSPVRFVQFRELEELANASDDGIISTEAAADFVPTDDNEQYNELVQEMASKLPQYEVVTQWDPEQTISIIGEKARAHAGVRREHGDNAFYLLTSAGRTLVPGTADVHTLDLRRRPTFFDVLSPDFLQGTTADRRGRAEWEKQEGGGNTLDQGAARHTLLERFIYGRPIAQTMIDAGMQQRLAEISEAEKARWEATTARTAEGTARTVRDTLADISLTPEPRPAEEAEEAVAAEEVAEAVAAEEVDDVLGGRTSPDEFAASLREQRPADVAEIEEPQEADKWEGRWDGEPIEYVMQPDGNISYIHPGTNKRVVAKRGTGPYNAIMEEPGREAASAEEERPPLALPEDAGTFDAPDIVDLDAPESQPVASDEEESGLFGQWRGILPRLRAQRLDRVAGRETVQEEPEPPTKPESGAGDKDLMEDPPSDDPAGTTLSRTTNRLTRMFGENDVSSEALRRRRRRTRQAENEGGE